MSYFAAQGFDKKQCTEALKVFRGVDRPCMAILWKTFDRPGGNCAQRFLFENRDKPHTLQIHFDDSTYRRRAEWYPGAVAPEYKTHEYNREVRNRDAYVLGEVRARAVEIMDFIENYGFSTTEIILSTGLEDDYTDKAYRILYEEIKKSIAPNILMARNPNATIERSTDRGDADFIELHGVQPKFREASRGRCITSTDGYGIEFQNRNRTGSKPGVLSVPEVHRFIRRSRKSGCRVFLWWPAPQGRGSAKFTEPSSRDFWIYRQDVSAVNKIIRRFEQ